MKLALAFLTLLALALPSLAQASTLGVENGTLRYTAGAGEINNAGIRQNADGSFELYDNRYQAQLGAGCRAGATQPGYQATCDPAGVTAISISLGDRDDSLCIIPAITVPVTLSGGAGRDTGVYCGESPPAIAADNDDVADDGPDARDDIRSDVEVLIGTARADQLGSGDRGGNLVLGDGDDTAAGGAGADRIEAAYVEDVGTEAGSFYPRGRDTVRCGGGVDFVFADRDDVLADDCEAFAAPTENGRYNFLFAGSRSSDLMAAPYGWGPADMLGSSGNDRIQTPSGAKNRVDGGSGSDTIREGGNGSNAVYGGSGNDVIVMSDQVNVLSTRDYVHCGSGRDRVYANRSGDRISRDCERVIRR